MSVSTHSVRSAAASAAAGSSTARLISTSVRARVTPVRSPMAMAISGAPVVSRTEIAPTKAPSGFVA